MAVNKTKIAAIRVLASERTVGPSVGVIFGVQPLDVGKVRQIHWMTY